MNLQDIFVDQINPDLVSVYKGRVISLDENFQDNGYLYVDLVDVESTNLEEGEKTATRATATFALRNCYNSWERPPEIKSKTNFMGSMNMTTSGDFHLRNYCFDVQTLTWFTMVSTALAALGVVLVPPTMISLDTTPLPGKAVSVNIAQAATEVVDEVINDSMRDIEPSDSTKKSRSSSTGNIIKYPSYKRVKELLQNNTRSEMRITRSNTRSGNDDPNEVIMNVIRSITNPIENILNNAFLPYYQFTECISYLFQIYENNLNDIEKITWPITQFTNLTDNNTTNESPNQTTQEALKNVLKPKIDAFRKSVDTFLPTINVTDMVTKAIYDPLAYIYQTIVDKIENIIDPIKSKITEIIATFIKPPISSLISFISMAIQPAISSLPTIVQIVVKLALKKVLKYLLGKPMQKLLDAVIEPISQILQSAAEAMLGKIMEIFTDSIKLIVNPAMEFIQKSVTKMIPFFDMSALRDKLKSIAEGNETFPDIYVGVNPLEPYKKFVDINWSDNNEIACMLKTLLDELPIPSDIQIDSITIENFVEEVRTFVINDQTGKPEAGPVDIEADPDIDPEYKEIIDSLPPDPSPDPSPSITPYLKKFSSKDEFMPYFLKLYPPLMEEATLGKGMFKDYGTGVGKKQPDVWVTNGVHYVTTDTGEKYIVAIEDEEYVSVYYPQSIEVTSILLEKGKIYVTEEVDHISNSDDTETNTTEGVDLVPKLHNGYSSLKPEIFYIQSVDENGNLLYKTKDPITGKDVGKTYDDIIIKYLQPKTVIVSMDETILQFINGENNLLDKINKAVSEGWDADNWLRVNLTGQPIYSFLTTLSNYSAVDNNNKIALYRKVIEEEEEKSERITNVGNFTFNVNQTIEGSVQKLIVTIYNQRSSSLLVTYKECIKYEFIFERKTGDNTLPYSEPSINYYMLSSDNTTWFTADDSNQGVSVPVFSLSYYKLSCDPDNLYIYVSQEVETEEINVVDTIDSDKVNNNLIDMLSQAISAIGQEGEFSPKVLVESIANKVNSVFSPIADSLDKITNTVDSTLEVLDDLKEINNRIEDFKKIGDKINQIVETAKPALEATAKAASAVALQSCSMSQSAKGKDFGFSSGDNYDLSTTTDTRSQLPYCKQLKREHLIEPNCKVLVLAVGAGKQNLYVIDILT